MTNNWPCLQRSLTCRTYRDGEALFSNQYDTDDALEIEDAQNIMVMLRMESKVDGAS
ncbi:MAG: hypothetical protein ABI977_26580 [Acidobacteriota bacterium]